MPLPSSTGAAQSQSRCGQKRRSSGTTRPAKRHRSKLPPLSGSRTPHGSYRQYYVRRHCGNPSSTDERLPLIIPLLKRYAAPALLDIGCNDGAVTTNLAASVSKAVGIDIDPLLVGKARKALRARAAPLRASAERAGKDGDGDEDFTPISCHVVQGAPVEPVETTARATSEGGGACNTKGSSTDFPFNLSFRCEDFASEKPGATALERGSFDIVLCLSVTKWVHLHGGDDALKRLFARMRDCLRPGGVLVLEPQPIRSYKRARQKKIGGANRNFRDDLKLRPDQFKEYLLGEEGGFESAHMLRDVCEEKGKMFNRPIMAFFKAVQEGEEREEGLEDDKEVGTQDNGIVEKADTGESTMQGMALWNGKANGCCK